MILQIIVLLFIILFALYMANEGPLSSLLLLIAAFFASALAIGTYPVWSEPILNHRPDFAYGVTFLLVFFLAFSLIRTMFDYLIRGDVELPLWPSRIIGGVFGFFTAMILIGSVMVGVQMLPLPSTILGYNRYNHATDLARNSPSGLWLDPDGFVTGIWGMVNGQSLGGHSFAKYHPQLLRELYADRYTVQYAGEKALPPKLLKVKFAGPLPKVLIKKYQIPTSAMQVVLVRTEVLHGDAQPNVSSDQGYFRVTPAEVQLITTGGEMYFPRGYLQDGRDYTPLKLDDPMVDDYRTVHGHRMVIQNWIFTIPKTDQPLVLRMKQTAEVNLLTGLSGQTLEPLPASDYPQLPYNNSSLDVQLAASGLSSAPVHMWIIYGVVPLSHLRFAMQDASGRLGRIRRAIIAGKPVWTTAKISGTPNTTLINMYHQNALNLRLQHSAPWGQILPVLLTSQVGTNTNDSMTRIRTYFRNTLKPLIASQRVASARLNATGQLKKPIKLGPGNYAVLIWSDSSAQMRVWLTSVTVHQGAKATVQVNSGDKIVNYSLAQ
ncbi:MAG: CvpA family protein [Planctomycetia bacterium]|nr:CvpA family protein [Planctomycetia bacterium]